MQPPTPSAIGTAGIVVNATSIRAKALGFQAQMQALEQIFASDCPKITPAQQANWLAFDKGWREWFAENSDPSLWSALSWGSLDDDLNAKGVQIQKWVDFANNSCGANIPSFETPEQARSKTNDDIAAAFKTVTSGLLAVGATVAALYLGVEFGPLIVKGIKGSVERRRTMRGDREENPIREVSKPGKHGTLHLYVIRYRNENDPGSPIFESHVWRYSLEHVYDAWNESFTSEGWEIVSVTKARRTA